MGLVWSGVHVTDGVPVAIKILSPPRRLGPAAQRAFRSEIRTIASLNHRGIVRVFDAGEVPPEVAARDERIEANSPYLVMELAGGGSLKSLRQLLPWRELKVLLSEVLGALGHAHARGVIHRDIKAGNILLCTPRQPRAGVRLADFGISFAIDQEGPIGLASGTPAYMAPEQLKNLWRDFGPGTDLYALGCLTWKLTTGRMPFRGDEATLIRQHLETPLPPFQPVIQVPNGLEAWLSNLLSKDIRDRYSLAADAADALSELQLVRAPRDSSTPRDPTWRHEDGQRGDAWLSGCGLGLYAVRTVPFVGRESERDVLWDAVCRTAESGIPRALIIQGPTGVGKSRLVEWIGQRAHETGLAQTLRAEHTAAHSPADGITSMFSRHLGIQSLSRDEAAHRVARWLVGHGAPSSPLCSAVVELLWRPSPEHPGEATPVPSATESDRIGERILTIEAHQRPVIVWIDDAQWGEDALRFVAHVLDQPRLRPVLFLITAQSEALAEAGVAQQTVTTLLARSDVDSLAIEPLPPREHRGLVRRLLGFDGELIHQIAERTGGNPLFALQIVGDWVQRGILRPSRDGFRLEPGADLSLPPSLFQAWSQRATRLLQGLDHPLRRALELAITLGRNVRQDEWQAVCQDLGLEAEIPDRVAEILKINGLALTHEEGWSFAHGMLVECLRALGSERPHWTSDHVRCASVLAARGAEHARIGRHLYEAKDWSRAADHLHRASEQAIGAGSKVVQSLVTLHSDALCRLAPPPLDPRWARAALLQTCALQVMNQFDEATNRALRGLELARDCALPRVEAKLHWQLGEIAKRRGQLDIAKREVEQALTLSQSIDDADGVAYAHQGLAHIELLSGRFEPALTHLEHARSYYAQHGDDSGVGSCRRFEGDIARLRGDVDAARRHFREALALHERAGDRDAALSARHGLAEVDRLAGDVAAAEAGYRIVADACEALGDPDPIPHFNLAMCLIDRKRWTDARAIFERIGQQWERQGLLGYLAVAQVCLLPCLAALNDWATAEQVLHRAEGLITDTQMVDLDVATAAELAARQGMDRGKSEWTARTALLAADQWEALQQPDGAQRCRALARLARQYDEDVPFD